ncbi:MAG: hypothetical protein HOE93_00845 [Nitrosopumilus sp.]|nr:hypothetical protein [Nitrosopumilus sp.]MBT3861620.1 hypothetical protein [Nitrosopumilus sp.]MBT3955851.1 hypothetical protein [Nitrosopumilus sp.]MBT4298562.1 hypothetical protein [Nitrosopumilus sp.]MBT4536058.1 hypothetical protein [Nitrosopumilus sp.]
MNFSYGVIAVVGILVAISLALIIAEPNDIIEPRIIETSENKITQIEKELNQLSVNPSLLTSASNVDGALVLEVEFRDDAGNIVDHVNYDIFATQDSDSILSDPASHRHPGKYPVHESTPLNDSLVEIQVIVQGLGHGDDIFGPKGIETVFTITPVVSPPIATSTEIKTSDNSGMSMDCQASLDCYTPSVVTVSVGDVVNMINSDSAAAMHSFTAGSVDGFTPSPSGTFDTGIMSADDSFEWIPENSGEVPYYCLLHTWMQGTIIVE